MHTCSPVSIIVVLRMAALGAAGAPLLYLHLLEFWNDFYSRGAASFKSLLSDSLVVNSFK